MQYTTVIPVPVIIPYNSNAHYTWQDLIFVIMLSITIIGWLFIIIDRTTYPSYYDIQRNNKAIIVFSILTILFTITSFKIY